MLGIVNLPFFMLVVFLLSMTPGPDTVCIVGHSVSQGHTAGLLSSLGMSASCRTHVLAIAFGLTALLATFTVAFMIIKAVSATYLVYLGGRMLLASPERGDATAEQVETPATKRARPFKSLFMQGLLTSVLNPRIVLFLPLLPPQFIDPLAAYKALAFLALGAVFIVMSAIWNSLVTWVAASVTRRVTGEPGIKR